MDEFVAETKEKLENVMQRLGWDLETLKKQRPTSVCRYDDKHGVLSQGLVKHELLCSLRKQGLSKKEAASVHDTGFCYAESPQVTSFSLSEQEKQNVLMSRCINDRYEIGGLDVHRLLTPPERLALYEYMIEKVRFENKLHKIPDDQLLFLEDDGDEDGKKEGLSIAEVRDLKRRRQTYRAKNVHVTKKSYTMVMREVLENQFKILEHRQKADAELEQELRRNPPKFRDAREGSVRSHREGSVRQRESSVRDGRSGSVRGQREGSSRHDVEREARTRDVPRAPDIQAPREREPSRARGDGERWRHDKFDEKQPQPLPRIDSRVLRSMSRSHDRRETRDQMDVPRDFGVERAQSRDHQERSRDYGDVRDRLGYPHEKREYSRDHDRTRGHDVTRDSSRARYYDGTPDSSGARDHDGTRDSSRARDHDGKRDSSRTRDHDGTRDRSRTRDHERTRGSSRTPSGKYKDHYDKSARAHGDRTGHHSRDQTRDTPPRGTVSSQVELHYDDEPDVKESSSRLKHRSRSRSKRSKSGDRRKSRDSRKSREGSSKKKKSTKKKSRKRKRSATEDESTERKAKRHKHKQKKKKKKRSDSPLVSDVDELVDSDDVDIPSDVDSDHVSGNDVGVGSDVVGESDVQESEEEEEEEEEEEKEEEEGEAEEEEEEEENVSVDEEEENVSVDYEEAEHLSVDEDELSEPSLSPSP